jgi:FkbM family methyltransferase
MLAFVLGAVLCLVSCSSSLSPQKKYVFIDGGAHLGESYVAFQKTNLYSQYPWEIVAIEANPNLLEQLPQVRNLTVLSKAMWVKDGTVEFFLQTETSGRNSMFEDNIVKERVDGELQPITVESFDFSQWLKNNYSQTDYVILSMDIEGAEYQIIRKMLKDETIQLVDRLYVELHESVLVNKMSLEQAIELGKRLLRRVERTGVLVFEDSAEGIMKRGDWIDFLL